MGFVCCSRLFYPHSSYTTLSHTLSQRRLTAKLLHHAVRYGSPTSADPGWCYLDLVTAESQDTLRGLGPFPSRRMVHKLLKAIGATLLPCRITHYRGTTHLHHCWSPHTATSLLRARRVSSPKPLTIGATTAHDSSNLTVACQLQQGHKEIRTSARIDSGVTGTGFISPAFVAIHGITTSRVAHPRQLNVIDGRASSARDATHVVSLTLNIQGHYGEIELVVIELGDQDLKLGIPWLRYHDVLINFREHTLSFPSPRCSWHKPRPNIPAPMPPPQLPVPQHLGNGHDINNCTVCRSLSVGPIASP